MKQDAKQLISEAIELLGEDSSSKKPRNSKAKRTSSPEEPSKDDQNLEVQEKAENDRSKDTSPERSFWFKLAEQKL